MFYRLYILGICMMFLSCQKLTTFEQLSFNEIVSLSLVYTNDITRTYRPISTDYSQTEIQVQVPAVPGSSLSNMRANIIVANSCTIVPAFKSTMDFSKPYRFSVIAENGEERKYLLVVYN
jgi:hypothetical protein